VTVKSGRVAIAAAIAAACAHAAFLHSQEQPRPTFKTEANYVRVDVFPTRDGVPVDDLSAEDFEVFEDKVPQKIDAFQHIVVRGNAAQDARREPHTVAESRAMLEDPNARVFVIFLDVGHVDVAGSHDIRKPLVDTLNRVIGEDDLVAVMTPEMAATDLTFARKTTTIEGFLTRNWPWGERDRLNPLDPVERSYEACYGSQQTSPVAAELIARRREKQTLDALEDLVVYLRSAREERKTIFAITDGWRLYRPSAALTNAGRPTPPPVGVIPGTGRLGIGDRDSANPVHFTACERDRLAFGALDDASQFRTLLDEANRASASFYPIDPRGLAVFDSPLSNPQHLDVDAAALRERSDALRTLAEATDGTAIITNDIAGGLRRIVDAVSSYYLLGYYSSGKLDGKFHAISVRVKRPGVQVRARRGYLAARPAAASAPTRTSAPTSASSIAEAGEREAIDRALAPLGNYGRELPIRIQAAAGWPGVNHPVFWVVGELAAAQISKEATDVELTLTQPNGGPAEATAHARIEAGARTFRAAIAPAEALPPDDYVVRARIVGGGRATPAPVDLFRLALPASPDSAGALVYRRGPLTANREVPTADLRFRRSEHLLVEMPVGAAGEVSARLLDRTGKPLPVPVASSVRDDADGSRWQTARLTLAPLAVGDYLIEITRAGHAPDAGRVLVAFRLIA
jgi:VWFA-related protein